ncbi:MAG: DUF3524 domain-containing protein [Actinomycetota bacterium]
MAKVLIVEPYLAGSHRAWAQGWAAHSRHAVTVIGHEGRHWRWRMRGAAVSLSRDVVDHVDRTGPVDVVVASNMLDLAGFVGLSRRAIGEACIVQYLHENQLSYPRQPGESLDSGLAWMQWRGAATADELWWNSGFHRDAFVAALDALLATAPDHDHGVERSGVLDRSWIASPGIAHDELRRATGGSAARPLIVSNQRWHHDKDVGAVVRAVRRLVDSGVDVDLAVVGDPAGGEAERIDPLLDALGDRVVARGLLDRSDYVDLLGWADIVVSAAKGENFGIAVVEAIAAGAWPVLPRGLSYPEIIPTVHHDDCLYGPGELGTRLAATVRAVEDGASAPDGLADAMASYAWPHVAERLDDRIDALGRV